MEEIWEKTAKIKGDLKFTMETKCSIRLLNYMHI